jgi:hypothetical protein
VPRITNCPPAESRGDDRNRDVETFGESTATMAKRVRGSAEGRPVLQSLLAGRAL